MQNEEFPLGYRRCSRCGAANIGRLAHCLRCGSKLPFEPMEMGKPETRKTKAGRVRARFCARCGKPVPADRATKYCRHCGQPIVEPTELGG